jgi:hypothetical protein
LRGIVCTLVAALLAIPIATSSASIALSDEGCQAQSPLQPACSYEVTHTSATPITGAGGIGDWLVTVKRGKQILKFESLPDGRPTFLEISFKIGDKVTAKALSPGSGLTVGHLDP